jgi:Sec-independent protein secretion pathway component TatC
MNDVKTRLSTLWIVVMFNMVFADVLTLYIPEHLQDALSGSTAVEITEELMLAMAVIIQIPILMIYLSRYLKYRVNRWANIIASAITIVFVVAGGSLVLHYVFFAAVEVVCLSLIIWYAWKWQHPEAEVPTLADSGARSEPRSGSAG